MAKKTRRARLSPTQRYMPTPGAPTPAEAPTARSAVRAAPTMARPEPNPEEYKYIASDLKRIGILAGSILTVLIALRLFIFR